MELSYGESLKFLNRQAITSNGHSKNELCLLTYQGVVLGRGKVAGQRINNLYPKAWMLRQLPKEDEKFSLAEY
jgi:NOL1/NOP2/fmu family ribosome biogenesis protein